MVKMASSKARGEREPEAYIWKEAKADITRANIDIPPALAFS